MEWFVVTLADGSSYRVAVFMENTKVVYHTIIDDIPVRFIGNPEWDTGGPFIIPESAPIELDLILLEEIADKIENYTL